MKTTVGMADDQLPLQLCNISSVLYLHKRLYYLIKVQPSSSSG